jgi:STE24 endopeptidase
MSETIATRTATVSPVRRRRAFGVIGSAALAVVAAEGGKRLLSPRTGTIEAAPVELADYFSREEIERGRRYARPQVALAMARGAVDLAVLAALVRRPPRILRASGQPRAAADFAGAAGLAVALSLPTLPLAAVSRKRAIDVGLVTQSWRGWGADLVKGAAIQAALAGVVGSAMLEVSRRYQRQWWLPAAGGSVLFGSLLAALAPVILDPIFNDFTPLPEGETRSDVLELARTAGVKVGEVYSVDASRRTTAANAYVSGLGPTKRVVLFDTLLDRYSRDQVRVVVAHELAHVRHRDVPRGILYATITAPATMRAVQELSELLTAQPGTATALPGLALSAVLVAAPLGLIGNGLSRAMERRADAYSLTLAQAPDAFISFERAIALQNVADLDPPRWLTRLLATHPPTAERIGFAVGFKQAGSRDGRGPAEAEPQAGEARP